MSYPRKALVTGGAGFIGSHLVLALLESGVEVSVIDDLSNGLESNVALYDGQVGFHRASILDQGALATAAAGCDTIFHLAAVSNVAQTLDQPLHAHAVNATGTMAVLEAARANRAHVVFSSSAAIYGDTPVVPTPEDAPKEPISMYGSQKLLGEFYVRNYCRLFGMTAACLRYFNVYGPRQRPDSPYSGVISIFAKRALEGAPITIHGSGDQTRDFIAVQDVVAANMLAAQARNCAGRAFNVCTGESTSVKTLCELTVEATSSPSHVSHGPAREGDIRHSQGIPTAAAEVLGFRAQTRFESGLRALLTENP
ncbi:MAG: NAD-dependent epimerase/dehydratase family protein [Armatimonadetes bacterium]|nr:NAD-dependent epimerase/dehydratase family protein [Armatimonadota bacterium]MBX3107714.1 NAD-dependent epimerase/dehydratase family protein [Fimbriimonadaceae bacterium]